MPAANRVLKVAREQYFHWKYTPVIREYSTLVEESSGDPLLRNTLGDLLLKSGQRARALEIFREVATIFIETQSTAKAMAVCKKICRIEPTDPWANETLLRLYVEGGLLFEAKRHFRTLVPLLVDLERYQDAVDYQARLVALSGQDPESHATLARLYALNGERKEAVSHYLRAIDLFRGQDLGAKKQECVEEVEHVTGLSIPRLQDWARESSKTDLDRLRLVSESSPGVSEETASREEVLAGFQEPASGQETGLSLNSTTEHLTFLEWAREVGQALAPDVDRVLEAVEEVLASQKSELEGSGPRVENALADFDDAVDSALDGLFGGEQTGRTDEILTYDDPTLSAASEACDDPEAYFDLAVAYREMGMFEDAVEKFEEAFLLYSSSSNGAQQITCCSMLSEVFVEQKRYENARSWAERGLEMPTLDDESWKALQYSFASAREGLGEPEAALAAFQDIGVKDPNYCDIAARIESLTIQIADG